MTAKLIAPIILQTYLSHSVLGLKGPVMSSNFMRRHVLGGSCRYSTSDHPGRAGVLGTLARILNARYEATRELKDLEAVKSHVKEYLQAAGSADDAK